MSQNILVIDEGTTSTRAMIFDRSFAVRGLAQIEIDLAYPQDGWVEQDASEIWSATLAVCKDAIAQAGGVESIAAIGITNQRETTLIWDRETGNPVGPAIVWQDRRTHQTCDALRDAGHADRVAAATGLLIDPYFSATKISWMLERDPALAEAAAAGKLAFGTVDTWLIWNLTGGGVHATDITNASRTLLMDLEQGTWSDDMASLFNVPRALLPDIRPSGGAFGESESQIFGRALPIVSAIGDQQAALVGQGCLAPGLAKITYGTGAFLVANTGAKRPESSHALLATSGYDTGAGAAAYALEGAIFNAGTVVKWLRDELGLIDAAADSEAMAKSVDDCGGVYFVPAFTGLGAPHWNAEARGEITGISRGTRASHIVRAGLEACAYQTNDLLSAFAADGASVDLLRVDGGMAANDWLMQFIADICNVTVERPSQTEMTALGAAALAAMHIGWETPDTWAAKTRESTRFTPAMPEDLRQIRLAGWSRAVAKAARPIA